MEGEGEGSSAGLGVGGNSYAFTFFGISMKQGFVAPAVLCLEGCRAVLKVIPGSSLAEFGWLEKPEEREEDPYLVV